MRALLTSAIAASLLLALTGADALAGSARLIDHAGLGLQVIHFEGRFQSGDLKHIQALVPKAKELNPSNQVYVSFHSPGGSLQEGIEIGHYLREQGIGTILLPGAVCSSACSFSFWGGFDREAKRARRIAMSGSRMGVHRASIMERPKAPKVDPSLVVEAMQINIARAMDYLNAMGVPPEVQKRYFSTSSKDIYILTERELAQSDIHILARSGSKWTLTNPEIATVSLPPPMQSNTATTTVPAPAPSPPQGPPPEQTAAIAVPADSPEPKDLRASSLSVEKVGQDATVVLQNEQSVRGRWMYGTRMGAPCLDMDVNPSQSHNHRKGFSLTLCFGETITGSMAYSPDIASGPFVLTKADLIAAEGRTEPLQVAQRRSISKPLMLEWERLPHQVHFTLKSPSGRTRPTADISSIRLTLDTTGKTITVSLPEAARDLVRRTLSALN